MKISARQYAQALFDLVSEESQKTATVMIKNFAQFLVKNNDAFKLKRIQEEFFQLWRQKFSVVRAEIKSAHPLKAATEASLEKYLKRISGATELELTKVIDQKIIGGVVVKYGDKIFDASLRSRLQKIKEAVSR